MRTVFTAVIKIRGVNPYILVSAVRANTVKPGWRKPIPVLVRINGKPDRQWRINLMPVGDGDFYLYLHGDVRRTSHASVGDRVGSRSTSTRVIETPPSTRCPQGSGWGSRRIRKPKRIG